MTEWDAGGQGIYRTIDIIYRGDGKGRYFFITFANWEYG